MVDPLTLLGQHLHRLVPQLAPPGRYAVEYYAAECALEEVRVHLQLIPLGTHLLHQHVLLAQLRGQPVLCCMDTPCDCGEEPTPPEDSQRIRYDLIEYADPELLPRLEQAITQFIREAP